MKAYTDNYAPDHKLSPADNARHYIAGFTMTPMPEIFKGLELQHAARSAFLNGGKLDTGKIYREVITGKDIDYEHDELIRFAVILEPSKEEMAELIADTMDGKHGAYPSLDGLNKLGWARQTMHTFGVSIDDMDQATRERIMMAKA
ncbi:MAG: hypothetical protein V1813_02155 [Candidatus Aenigmatarchaeota archaeon]